LRIRSIKTVAHIICGVICLTAASSFSATKIASGTVTDYSVSLYEIAGYHSRGFIWDIYFSNKHLIEREVVKSFEYKTSSDKNKKTSTLRTSHSRYQVFKMINKNKTTIKVFDHFNLKKTNDTFSDKTLYNINYEHNINLKSKLIIDILERITSEAEKNNTFKKIKSR
jgi:hypothetical protein